MTKGQFIRLYLGTGTGGAANVIAAAKSLSFHVSATVENATTKDTEDDWVVNEVTAVNFDISSNALIDSGESIASSVNGEDAESIMGYYESGNPVSFAIANASGDNNRTKGSVIVSGQVIVTQLTLNGPNRQVATYDTQLTGYGDFTVGA